MTVKVRSAETGRQRRWLWIIMVPLLAACGSTAPLPEDQYYRLVAARSLAPMPTPALDGRVHVELPRAAGVRRGRAVLYSEDPQHVVFQQYHYHHWEETPPHLIQRRLIESLRATGAATAATDHALPGTEYRIRSHLRRFDRLVDAGQASAVVELEVQVIDTERPAEPLLERSYTETVDADSTRMADTVRAFSEAVDSIVARLLADLSS